MTRELLELTRELDSARAEKTGLPRTYDSGNLRRHAELAARISSLQAQIASAKGLPYATRVDWPWPWSAGAPLPHVVASDHRLFLIYMAAVPNPGWDGTHAEMVDATTVRREGVVVVRFRQLRAHRFGAPNDEVFAGHPLADAGFDGTYGLWEVHNSPWLRELEVINSVHACYRPETWASLRHLFFAFHDSTFEAIADDVEHVETRSSSLAPVVLEYTARLWAGR